MLAIFVVDLQTRIGVATWLFYLIPLGSSIFLTRPGAPMLMAALSTILIIVDFHYSPEGKTPTIALLTRSVRDGGDLGVRFPDALRPSPPASRCASRTGCGRHSRRSRNACSAS